MALAGGFTLLPAAAEAQGHRGGHGGGRGGGAVFVGGGFYGPGWGFGFSPWWGFGPWGMWGYGPGSFQPEGGVNMGVAMMAGFGAVELNVKPNRADVWVDGKYMGEARDLDGYPSYLWLAEGAHRVAIHKGGFLLFDEPVNVQRGMKTEIKLKMQPGDSQPPGPKPGEKAPVDQAPPEKKMY